MLVPKVKVERINPEDNIRFIRNYLSKDKQENNTRPFYEKTIALYPELRDIDRVTDEDERETMIRGAVLRRLEDNREEIRRRMDYFSERFDMFMDGFIEASCRLFNYEWKTEEPVITCYTGYLPFYPRSARDKCFYFSLKNGKKCMAAASGSRHGRIPCGTWRKLLWIRH